MLPSEEDSPGDPAGVLALEEQALGLAILEAEDLGVTADIQLALNTASAHVPINLPKLRSVSLFQAHKVPLWNFELVAEVGAQRQGRWNAPCPGRSSRRRKSRRRYACWRW